MSISNLPIKNWFKLFFLLSSALVIASCDQNAPSGNNKTEEESSQVVKQSPVQVYFDDKEVIKLFPDTNSEEFILASTSLAFYPENISLKDHKLHLEYVVRNLNPTLKLLQLQFNAIVSLYNEDFEEGYKTIQLSLPLSYGYSNVLTLGNLLGQDTSASKRDSNKTIKVVSSSDASNSANKNPSSSESTKNLVVEDSPLVKLEDMLPSYIPPNAYFRVVVDYDLANFYDNKSLPKKLEKYSIDNYTFAGIRTLPVLAYYSEIGEQSFIPKASEEDDKAIEDKDTDDKSVENKESENKD